MLLRFRFGIHLVYDVLEVFGHHGAAQFQRVGQLALLHAEGAGQEGEALHLLVVGKLLLQGLDAGVEEGLYLGVLLRAWKRACILGCFSSSSIEA